MSREAINEHVVLRGIGGLVKGEAFQIDYGETVVIGRSSDCDISLKKCEKYLLLDPEERDTEKHFQTVSRKHARLSFYNSTSFEVEDLSSNGTFLDGHQIKKVVISDLKDNPHELLLGTKEKFVIQWGTGDKGIEEDDSPVLEDSDEVVEGEVIDDEDLKESDR